MTLAQETQQVRTSSLGWMMQRITGQLDRAMEARLRPHDLTLQHFAVMMTAFESDGLTQAEIGARFNMPPYTISRAIDHLADAGYLSRDPHPTSRRSHLIRATAEGQALASTLFSIVREVNAELVAPLSEDQKAAFRAVLETLMRG